jgi:hypothetical protein
MGFAFTKEESGETASETQLPDRPIPTGTVIGVMAPREDDGQAASN